MEVIKHRLRVCDKCSHFVGFVIEKYNGILPVKCICMMRSDFKYVEFKMKRNRDYCVAFVGRDGNTLCLKEPAGSDLIQSDGHRAHMPGFAFAWIWDNKKYRNKFIKWLEKDKHLRF